MLIPKGKGNPSDPSAYRPICMLDTAGKALEKVIATWIQETTEGLGGLSRTQFGFRKERSTLDAITMVIDTARKAIAGKRWRRGAKGYCAVVTLDVKNAFNSARWSCILQALQEMSVPSYLRRIIEDYFRDRTLIYSTEDGPKRFRVTGGVPQGSVLGPLLWNIMYDRVLRLSLPEGAKTIGFADDIAVVVEAKYKDEVTLQANQSILLIRDWLASVGLQLADRKTEALLISSRKMKEDIILRVGRHEIQSQSSLKYLGVVIDERLLFKEHIHRACDKAARVTTALARLMPNIGGPRNSRRRLITNVVSSILLYAAGIWSGALRTLAYRRPMVSVYRRSVLRVTSAFRTVSYEAACVVARMPPIELIAEERHRSYNRADRIPRTEERRRTIEIWQQRWDTTSKGRWTHRLIPRIQPWVDRKHGEVDYYLTQMLTEHGCYRTYQLRFKLDNTAECPRCPTTEETAEHVFFRCPRFQEEREEFLLVCGTAATVDNIVSLMLLSQEYWMAGQRLAAEILKKLRKEEKERHA